MKKTLTVLASAVLALGMLFVMGCKQPTTMNAGDAKDWKGQSNTTKEDHITLTVDNGSVDWYAVTDMHNVVLVKDKFTATKNTIDIPVVNFPDPNNKEVVLWIHQPDVAAKDIKDAEAGAHTFRGALTFKKGKGIAIKTSDYRDALQPVTVLTIVCNEVNNKTTPTGDNVQGQWSGDYRITEAAPLVEVPKSNPKKYSLVAGLKVENFGDIEQNGGLKTFIWPAGTSLVGIKQPNRFVPGIDPKAPEYNAYTKQKDWYWCVEKTFKEYNEYTVKSHDTNQAVPINGGTLASNKDKEEMGGRSAAPVKLIYTEEDFITPVETVEMK